jgi:hypothetical protein
VPRVVAYRGAALKRDVAAVGRHDGDAVEPPRGDEASRRRPVGVHHVQLDFPLGLVVARRLEHDAAAVGGEHGVRVPAGAEGEPARVTDGSSQLVHALLAHDLVDVLHLLGYPLVLGSGKRVLPEGVHATFELKSATPYPTGVVGLHYARRREERDGSRQVPCDSQQEIDYYWEQLSEGGRSRSAAMGRDVGPSG